MLKNLYVNCRKAEIQGGAMDVYVTLTGVEFDDLMNMLPFDEVKAFVEEKENEKSMSTVQQ